MCWVHQSDDAYRSFDLACNVFLYIFKHIKKNHTSTQTASQEISTCDGSLKNA